MHWQAMQFLTIARTFVPDYFYNRSVLEVGSYTVNDSIRDVFQTDRYIGVDLCEGPGVDIVAPGEKFSSDEKFDVVVSCECFEHNPKFYETFENMFELLKSGGLLIFTCATEGRPEHGTSRTDPSMSPGTFAVGIDYYRNLTSDDFSDFEIPKKFASAVFYTNKVSSDLYFIGIKNDVPNDPINIPAEKISFAVKAFEVLSREMAQDSVPDRNISRDFLKYPVCPQLAYELYLRQKNTQIVDDMLTILEAESALWLASGRYYLLKAEISVDQEKYHDALAFLRAASEKLMNKNRINFLKGCCYEKLGRYEECVSSWRRITSNAGAGLNFRLATVYEKLGHLNEAFSTYAVALSIEPDNPVFIFRFGVLKMKMKEDFRFDLDIKSLFLAKDSPRWILVNLYKNYYVQNATWFDHKHEEINRRYPGLTVI